MPTFPNPVAFFPVDFSAFQLQVTPGDLLAVVLYGSAGNTTYQWIGSQIDPYPPGSNYEKVIGNHNWVNEGAFLQSDLGFRTLVETGGSAVVPEPGALSLLSVGALAVTGYALRRRARRVTRRCRESPRHNRCRADAGRGLRGGGHPCRVGA